MPSSMRRYFCKLCGGAFTTNRTDKLFCCPEHQKDFKNMRIAQGYQLIELAIASRLRRGSKEEVARASQARRDMYAILDRICGDERERITKRAVKVAEIRAAKSNLPLPVEPNGDECESAERTTENRRSSLVLVA